MIRFAIWQVLLLCLKAGSDQRDPWQESVIWIRTAVWVGWGSNKRREAIRERESERRSTTRQVRPGHLRDKRKDLKPASQARHGTAKKERRLKANLDPAGKSTKWQGWRGPLLPLPRHRREKMESTGLKRQYVRSQVIGPCQNSFASTPIYLPYERAKVMEIKSLHEAV